jgi:G protein-coupled receptor Mth (Methuselah protein)
LYSPGDFCALYSNIPGISSEEIFTSYMVCYDVETPVEADQRKLTGIIYPTAILISSVFILVTIIFYLTVGSLRKTLFAKITLGFLLNVFVCYILLAIVYNFLLSDDHRDFLESKTCKVLGYIIHHTFIAFFFWMSAMAFNIAKSLSTMKVVRNCKSSFKSLSVYFLYAQGIPLLFTVFIVLMDIIKPIDAPLPNVGEFDCFVGSEYEEGKSFFQASEFVYYYLIVIVIITFNILCFSVTAFNLSRHWQAMKNIQTTSDSDGLVEHLTIIIKLSLIMGVPWLLDIISAGLKYRLGSEIFSVRLALDILNLLTGILIFLSLICKPSVWSQIKATYSGTEDRRNLQLSNGSTSSSSFKKHSKGHVNNGAHV